MRIYFFTSLLVLFVSSCSAPKYTASFMQYDKHEQLNDIEPLNTAHVVTESLTASTDNHPIIFQDNSNAEMNYDIATSPVPSEISKAERKWVKKQIRAELKSYSKATRQTDMDVPQEFEWDNDLKLAAIFGAAGLVGILLGSVSVAFSIIGGIALIIGVVFFVQWVIRQ